MIDDVVNLNALDVSEVFGPTFQGEGPSLGRRCAFVRLVRCNLDCGEGHGSTWCCDTPYTWRWRGRYDESRPTFEPREETHHRTVDEVVEEILALHVPLVVVSGGEPLLQRGSLAALARTLHRHDVEVEVETNGTILPGPALAAVTAWNVSPKLANSGVPIARRWHPDVLTTFVGHPRARFKFVAAHRSDLAEVELYDLPRDRVWIMPAGTEALLLSARLVDLADDVLARGWNLTTRLHVAIWGDERGR